MTDHDAVYEDVARIVGRALDARLPEDVAAHHEQLIRAAASGASVRPILRRTGRARRRVAVLALAAAMVVGSSAVAFADGAVPGDTLYGLDRALERVQDAMARDPGSKANTHLAHAAERLREIDALQSVRNDDEIPDAAQAAAGHDDKALAEAGKARGRDAEAIRAHVLAMIGKHVARLREVQLKLAASGNGHDAAIDAIGRAIENGSKAAEKVQHGRAKHEAPAGVTPAPGTTPAPSAPGKSGEHRQDAGPHGQGQGPDGGQPAATPSTRNNGQGQGQGRGNAGR